MAWATEAADDWNRQAAAFAACWQRAGKAQEAMKKALPSAYVRVRSWSDNGAAAGLYREAGAGWVWVGSVCIGTPDGPALLDPFLDATEAEQKALEAGLKAARAEA